MRDGEKDMIVTLADKRMSTMLLYQSKLVNENMKDYQYCVYNLGMPPDHLKILVNRGANITNWNEIHTEYNENIGSNKVLWKKVSFPTVTLASLKKAFCIRHAIESNKDKKFLRILYMDADAFPLKRIGSIWDLNFNLAVTLRKPYKRKVNLANVENPIKWRYRLLNAGVQMWQGTPETLLKLINIYINQYLTDKNCLADQAALNRLVDRCEEFDWTSWERNYKLVDGRDEFWVRVMSCRHYNWFTRKGKKPGKNVVIAHAKGLHKRKIKSEDDVHTLIDRTWEVRAK